MDKEAKNGNRLGLPVFPQFSRNVAGNLSSYSMVNGVEGRGSVAGRQKCSPRLVHSTFHNKYTGHTTDNIHLRFQ